MGLVPGGVPAPRGVWSRGPLLPGGGGPAPRGVPAPGGGAYSRGAPGGDPPETATAAGGTHPTGMHSCGNVHSNPNGQSL